jgi:hypothetical protein
LLIFKAKNIAYSVAAKVNIKPGNCLQRVKNGRFRPDLKDFRNNRLQPDRRAFVYRYYLNPFEDQTMKNYQKKMLVAAVAVFSMTFGQAALAQEGTTKAKAQETKDKSKAEVDNNKIKATDKTKVKDETDHGVVGGVTSGAATGVKKAGKGVGQAGKKTGKAAAKVTEPIH